VNQRNLTDPGEIFNFCREKLIHHISRDGQRDGFDGILLCIHKSKNQLSYAAANNVPVLVRNKELHALQYDRMPVGQGEKTAPFNSYTIPLMKGDIIYLYTDGYADQFGGPNGKKIKSLALNNTLLRVHNLNIKEQKAVLDETFMKWKDNNEQVDDVCLLGIQF
jgi:serine phosphatase RsbU (regulator of sigma subunit)